jgi:transcriptional regulator
MYIPKMNLMADKNEMLSFMKRFSFATLVNHNIDKPVATHLPFLISEIGEEIELTAHFAKANTHWKLVENDLSLVIFSEPHAYISPKNYEKTINVPTWNYVAVHAYGKATIITDTDSLVGILENSIEMFDPAYRDQWDQLPEDYKRGMLQGIVGFKIRVTDIQGKKKLSQNKTPNEQKNIIASLQNSRNTNESMIAEYMQKEL